MTDPQRCQHHRINNTDATCVECGAQMVTITHERDTIMSAPNAAACLNPACVQALKDGTYDDSDPPSGCTNPHGAYVPDRSRERTIVIGYRVTYECDRCRFAGTYISSDVTVWDCGKSHQGDYIPAPKAARSA